MRKLIALVAILACSAVVSASTHVAVTSNGSSTVQFVPGAWPDTIAIEITITTDITGTGMNGIWAAGGGLMGPAGLTVTLNSYRTGWTVIGNPFPAGSPLDGVNDWGGMDGDGNFAYAISSPGGIVARLTLSGLAGLQPGVYEIATVSDSSYGQVSGTGYWATGYGPNVMAFDTSTPLRIIPEPASILLLAGALPFLRRRVV